MPFSRYALVALCAVTFPTLSHAIVTEPDSAGHDMPRPAMDYVVRWGSDATAYAISPRSIIASAHGAGGQWGISIAGQYRLMCSWTPHPSAHPAQGSWGLDIGIATLCPDQPDLPGFYPIHRSAPTVGTPVLVGGSGFKRGTPYYLSGQMIGYNVDESSRDVTYGMNRVSYFTLNGLLSGGSYVGPDVFLDFSAPTTSDAMPYESSGAYHDSGGLIAVFNAGRWEAVGVMTAESNSNFYSGSTTGRALDRPDILRWISQIDSTAVCMPDLNGSRSLDVDDIFTMLQRWFAPGGYDYDNSGSVNVNDIFAFLQEWFQGCH